MPLPASADAFVILLHGVGGSGADMKAVADGLRPALPGAAFATPDAPFGFERGPGRQWFSVAGVTAENRPDRIEGARPAFDATLRAALEAAGFADRLDRVVLVGFSQGAMMLLDAVASGRWPVAAGVAFAGRLASPLPLAPARTTRLLLVHGAEDAVVPAWETPKAAEALTAAGMPVETCLLPDLGHAVSTAGIAAARGLLAAALPPRPAA